MSYGVLSLLGYLLLLCGIAFAFVPHVVTPPARTTTTRLYLASTSPTTTRRDFWNRAGSVLVLAPTLLVASPVHAAKEVEPLTPENVDAAFAALTFELDDPKGGVHIMQQKLDERDWEGLLDFTKTYDLILRKQKWGRAKALLTNNAEKEVATITGNAVTFDLIGINRAARAGKENPDLANKYLNELRTDIQRMIDMQKTIQFDQGGFEMYMNAVKASN